MLNPLRHILPTLAVIGLSTLASAGPWIDSGDERLRHHIQLLADKDIITVPVTTWPLMWSGVAHDIQRANPRQLDQQTRWSLQYVKFAFNQQTGSGIRLTGQLSGGSEPIALSSFADDRREKSEASAALDWMGGNLAVKLDGSYANNPEDGDEFRLDGSYLSYSLGNWAFTAGAIDRWWGPGWRSSLILSDNARPTPGLSLQRNFSDAFKTPWLSWLGSWQFTAFAGQLESERHVPDAYLLGARANFRPLPSLEISLSRTAQWGGEGRPQSWSSLKDLMLGNDNRGSDGIDQGNEPGNQLGSIDGRYSFQLAGTSSALYGQFTGEDESGGLPSRGIVQLGLESSFISHDIQHRVIIEASDTTSESYSDARPNYSYEHGIYKNGYRYKGRPIGASTDNDSRQITLAADHYLTNGHQLSWAISKLQLNQDRSNVAAPGGSIYAAGIDMNTAEVSYHLPLSEHWQATMGLRYASKPIGFNGSELDSSGSLALKFKY